jgi:hypothetical protein
MLANKLLGFGGGVDLDIIAKIKPLPNFARKSSK